ncbi:MAG: phosphate ABC transporter substrate-binding protein [Burkholderiales bacterium]|nr:phosphate ABC transporter substrate-binding protein [Burkholderiales bacterium]
MAVRNLPVLLLLLSVCIRAEADIAIVVGAKAPVDKVAADEVTPIFLGKSVNFANGSPVAPVFLSESDPLREKFDSEVLKKSETELKAYWSKMAFTGRAMAPHEYPSAAEIKKAVAGNPKLVGYIDSAEVDGSVKVLLTIK